MNLSKRLYITILAAGLVPTLIISFLLFQRATHSLEEEAFIKLTAIRDMMAARFEENMGTIKNQIASKAEDYMVQQAMVEFTRAFNFYSDEYKALNESFDETSIQSSLDSYYKNDFLAQYKTLNNSASSFNYQQVLGQLSDQTKLLQYSFISDSEYKLGEKDKLESLDNNTSYDRIHSRYHHSFRSFLTNFGFYDIFLIDAESGHIVYSVYKELDFATSLIDGPYASSGLGKAFKEGVKLAQGEVYLTDMEAYTPSYEMPAAFISTPIYEQGNLTGVLCFQIPVNKINNVMTNNNDWQSVGLGESGEVYLIGEDYKMRSNSRFLVEDKNGYFDALRDINYDDGTISLIDKRETSILLQSVKSPSIEFALDGKNGSHIIKDYRGVDVLSSYKSVQIEGLNWAIVSELDLEEADRKLLAFRYKVILIVAITAMLLFVIAWALGRSISRPIENIIDTLFNSAKSLEKTAYEVNDSSQMLSDSVETSTAAFEETTASLNELFDLASENSNLAKEANNYSVKSKGSIEDGRNNIESLIQSMTDISNSSQEITEMVNVIEDIAFQTNLLSLNASIEAARAGEAGAGFAVVAEAVRNLAAKSSESAKQISSTIEVSKQRIESGKAVADTSQKSMTEISTAIEGVVERNNNIDLKSNDQNHSINQLHEAMNLLTNKAALNSQNAANLIQQADGLNKQSENLAKIADTLSAMVK